MIHHCCHFCQASTGVPLHYKAVGFQNVGGVFGSSKPPRVERDEDEENIHLFICFFCWVMDTITVDGSEIPRPTTWDGAKTLVHNGMITHIY